MSVPSRVHEPRQLSGSALPRLDARVRVPTYDRGAVKRSVVHIGVGGFHRAHQAMYFEELAEQRISQEWGVTGVNLCRRGMKQALDPQDCLFTVVQRDEAGDQPRVVGALSSCLFAGDDPEAVIALLADDATRLVTLTVTGDGYTDDLARPLVAALDRRRRARIAPFTVLSCDNVPYNGRIARDCVTAYARTLDEDLADWIDRHVSFPSSMVDRIVPATTDEDRALLVDEFGYEDNWPGMTEPFTQWIVEDDFCNGRPPLDEVGVQFVPDVTPYQITKTRMLNAAHSALGYLGSLSGHVRTDQAMRDVLLKIYLADFMSHDVAPLLPSAPGIDIPTYKRTLLHRFSNPKIGDQLARLCGRGSTKVPSYLLPSIHESVKRDRPHPYLTLAVAAWFRYLRGTDCAGRPIEVRDELKPQLQPLAIAGGSDATALLSQRAIFGDLGQNERFASSVSTALSSIDRFGVAETVTRQLTDTI